jgi:alpha-L-fucosidase 2
MWARLGDGDKAAALLDSLVAHATAPNVWHDDWKQIDGHLGSPAAIAEMLLQSHTGEIVFLPALPTAWPSGAVKGLRARGGATISLDWKGGKLSTAILVADRAGRFKLRYGEVTRIVKASPGQPIKLDGALGLTGSGLA